MERFSPDRRARLKMRGLHPPKSPFEGGLLRIGWLRVSFIKLMSSHEALRAVDDGQIPLFEGVA